MTARVRRVLLWSGMFALAFAGGSWLGGFTVAGLVGSDYGLADASANEAALFWDKLSAERAARAEEPAALPEHLTHVEPVHVCEGCDAGETRYRQFAEYLGLYYAPETPQDAQAAQAPAMQPMAQPPRPRLPEPAAAPVPPPRPRVPAPPSLPAPPPQR